MILLSIASKVLAENVTGNLKPFFTSLEDFNGIQFEAIRNEKGKVILFTKSNPLLLKDLPLCYEIHDWLYEEYGVFITDENDLYFFNDSNNHFVKFDKFFNLTGRMPMNVLQVFKEVDIYDN